MRMEYITTYLKDKRYKLNTCEKCRYYTNNNTTIPTSISYGVVYILLILLLLEKTFCAVEILISTLTPKHDLFLNNVGRTTDSYISLLLPH